MRKRITYLIAFFLLFVLADRSMHQVLLTGLHKYYGLGTNAKIALIGHSHLMLGVNKTELEKQLAQPVSKYTNEGVNVSDRQLMIDYLLEKNPKTEVIVYGVDAWMFTGEGLSANSYKLFLPFMGDAQVREKIKANAPIEEFWQKRLIATSRYTETAINGALRGHMKNWSNYKLGVVETVQLQKNIAQGSFRKLKSEPENRNMFEATLRQLTEREIQVVLVYVPTISFYNQAEPDKFDAERSYFKQLAATNPKIEYLEYLEGWESAHHLFFDPIHLNPEGQQAFTAAFANDLKGILK